MKEFSLTDSPLTGSNLIEASAGTGKTYNITWLFLRLLIEKKIPVNEILIVTFTQAATEELRGRTWRLLREALLSFSTTPTDPALLRYMSGNKSDETLRLLTRAMRSFDEAAIFTIHGFCQRILHENAFESGVYFDTELVTDQEDFIRESVEDFWRKNFYASAPEFVSYACENKFSPGYLKKFLGNKPGHPDLNIIPETKFQPYSIQNFNSACSKVRKSWTKARGEVEKVFKEADLNRKAYKKTSVPIFLEKMDGFLSSKVNSPTLFKEFDKFTSGELAVSMNKKKEPPRMEFFDLCEALKKEAALLREAMDYHLLHLKNELFKYVGQELDKKKRVENVRSFGDLLLHLRSPLKDPVRGPLLAKAVRSKYRAALIDEFQDTDPVQWDIFRTLFQVENRPLFLIGDPKQAIYAFRGADVHAYIGAASQVHSRYTLARNYRSESGLIRAANTIFTGKANPFAFEEIRYIPIKAAEQNDERPLKIDGKLEPPFQIWLMGRDKETDPAKPVNKGAAQERITRAVAIEIRRLLDLGAIGRAVFGEKPLKPQDITILVRTHNEARLIQSALVPRGIPSVLDSAGNVFDSREAGEMQRLLAGVAEPNNRGLLKAALTTDILGLNGEGLEKMIEDEEGWNQRLLDFRDYNDLWNRHDFMRMFRTFMIKENVRKRLLGFPGGERRVTNFLHIAEVLHKKSIERKLGMTRTLAWLSEQRNEESLLREKEHEIRLESDEDAVKIVTIHKSKGLEYPVVFCPFTWAKSDLKGRDQNKDFVFHDNRGRLTLAIGPMEKQANLGLAEKELLAENLRLFYVALTRAKSRCYLAWGPIKTGASSALAYLFHNDSQPEDFFMNPGKIEKMSDEDLLKDLNRLVEAGKGSIQLTSLPEEKRVADAEIPEQGDSILTHRVFTGEIREDWKISSYSAMVFNKHAMSDLPDRDTIHGRGEEPGEDEKSSCNIFTFPRGTKPGTFLHEIFETIDFTKNIPAPLVEEKLKQYGYDPAIWSDTICALIKKVLSIPLVPENRDLQLSKIPARDRSNELEFYFPLNPVKPRDLASLFARFGPGCFNGDFPEKIGGLNFSPAKGFMKGFMDMVFHFQGRFYLLDWKSNYLGGKVEDYNQGALLSLMENEFYALQYHIYVIALNRHLSLQIPGYDYNMHFGGVFYIFLRGVDENYGPEYGIFRDFPPWELVEELSRKLMSGPEL